MRLEAIKYTQFPGDKREWSLEGKPEEGQNGQWATFGQINLIVGQNATGKTRALNVISSLADLLGGNLRLALFKDSRRRYEARFSKTNPQTNALETILYTLEFKNAQVLCEELRVNQDIQLKRTKENGEIYYQALKQKVKQDVPEDELMVLRRDRLQHPFLEDLYEWSHALYYYQFGTNMGQNRVATPKDLQTEFNLRDFRMATPAFIKGESSQQSTEFKNAVRFDMQRIGYDVEEVGLAPLKHLPIILDIVDPNWAIDSLRGLYIKEAGLSDVTEQMEMSQGMFRAFSLIIQLNYALLTGTPSCILIDDIGEGLDYERSTKLIDLIIEKAKNSSVQIVMATNDRFVMNKVPLEYWSVIAREKNRSLFYNYRNSKEVFDQFEYVGLNNFDFFASEFYLNGFQQETAS